MTNPTRRFATSKTGAVNQAPVAILATTKIDTLLGSIIQLDGRQSYDPEKQPITYNWSFTRVPIGSEVESAGFKDIRPGSTAVSFVPDKTGIYIVQLIVNDGELDSAPVTATVNIQLSRVPCGENIIPDAHFLWSYISDFWKLVEDREKITSIWSAVIQNIGSDLIKLWGNDLNKSLNTIQSTFQRRWQKLDLRTDVSEAADQRIIAGKTDSGVAGVSGPFATIPGTGPTSVFRVPLGSVGDGDKTNFTNLKGNYGVKGRLIVIDGETYTLSRASNETDSVKTTTELGPIAGSNVVGPIFPTTGDHTDGEVTALQDFEDADATFQTDGITGGGTHGVYITSGPNKGLWAIDSVPSETKVVISDSFSSLESGVNYVILDLSPAPDLGDTAVGDQVTIKSGSDSGTYEVLELGAYVIALAHPGNPGGVLPVFAGNSGLLEMEIERRWSLVIIDEEGLTEGLINLSWRVPHLLHVPGAGFEELGVRAGDVITFEVERTDVGLTTEVFAQVVGADRDRIGFEFSGAALDPSVNEGSSASLVESGGVVTVSGLQGMRPTSVGGVLEILNGDHPGRYTIRSFISEDSVVIDNTVSSGADPSNPSLQWVERSKTGGNFDRLLFRKIVQDLRIVSAQASALDVAAAAEALISFMPTGINLNTRPFSRWGITFKATTITHNSRIKVDDNLIGMPALQESVLNPPVVLRENLDYIIEDGALQFTSGMFSISEPSPEEMWAECAIYDNSDAIERNFGRLVGLSQGDLTESRTRAPYLSAVKGLFFAYTNGPKVANIRLGLQILLGLPFAEEYGVILEIQDPFTEDTSGATLGRILIEDVDEATGTRLGFRRVYFYSSEVGLETNPATARTYRVGDRISQFAPISKGVEVVDYVKDPVWWTRSLLGLEVLKYFIFKVFIDSRVFNSDDVEFAIEFVKQIKPAYTKVITSALQTFSDDIEAREVFGGGILAKFYDNVTGLEATSRTNDLNGQGVIIWRVGSPPFNTRSTDILRDVDLSEESDVVILYGEDGNAGVTGTNRFEVQSCEDPFGPGGVRVGDVLRVTTLGSVAYGDHVITGPGATDTQLEVAGTPFTAAEYGLTWQVLSTRIKATSLAGWDTELIRGRVPGGGYTSIGDPYGSMYTSPQEGDILVVLMGQEASFPAEYGLYEILEVQDENNVVLGWRGIPGNPDNDPVIELERPPLLPGEISYGQNLFCSILRREWPTLYRSDDLVTDGSNVVTSATSDFRKQSVRVGDHLVIEGPNLRGEWLIDDRDSNLKGSAATLDWDGVDSSTGLVTGLSGMSASMVGRHLVFDNIQQLYPTDVPRTVLITAYVSASSVEIRNDFGATATRTGLTWHIAPQGQTLDQTSLVVRNADGSTPVLATASDQRFRIVRPESLQQVVTGVRYYYDSSVTEQCLRAQYEMSEGVWGIAHQYVSSYPHRDIFVPGMVGQHVGVSGHSDPAKNGVFLIKQYIGPGQVAIDVPFTETSTVRLTLTFGVLP